MKSVMVKSDALLLKENIPVENGGKLDSLREQVMDMNKATRIKVGLILASSDLDSNSCFIHRMLSSPRRKARIPAPVSLAAWRWRTASLMLMEMTTRKTQILEV